MSENLSPFYSSLTAEQIEATLVGAVRFNANQTLSSAQKAAARQNIGAGESNTGLIILGFFATLQALIDSLQTLPDAGDAYGIGTPGAYDIYIWDAVHSEWVNNGRLDSGSDVIDDGATSASTAWSSSKVSAELANKQNKITVNGIVKGDGTNLSAAVKGTDYGALSFTVTLPTAGWSGNAQSVSNANFLASGFAYMVAPVSASFAAYGEAGVYADDVSTDGTMTFHCNSTPSSNLSVNVVRVVSA